MELNLTKENFEAEAVNSPIPVISDFWAPWCGPCRMLGPVIAEIAEENEGKIKVCKVNVDEQEELAMAFKVSSIPLVVRMDGGKVTKMSLGYKSKEALVAEIL